MEVLKKRCDVCPCACLNVGIFFAYGNAVLTEDNVRLLQENAIPFEMGTIDSEEEIVNYWNGAYHYCSGIESNEVVASEIDLDAVLGSPSF